MSPQDYNYRLPQELIAHTPAEPRDSARLLVYSVATDEIVLDTFEHIARYIPHDGLLVLNDTQVVPARLELMKLTGGTVRVLFLVNEWDKHGPIKGLPDRKLSVGDRLFFDHRGVLEVVGQQNEEFSFRLHISVEEFERLCQLHGRTPLPPYIHTSLNEEEARAKYQTVFAAKPASVAAPTASLHFTDRVFASLDQKGIARTSVTLHVGRGTFAPLSAEALSQKKLHSEPIEVSVSAAEKIVHAKKSGSMIISAGTTATRTLEAAADSILKGEGYTGETTLMISPPYQFKIVGGMITNFHLPNTSLIMLVDAFLRSRHAKRSWRDLYERAVQERFRFYSFGDAMLII
jgi:S-adenosylmethionine:tRNA ribosyltransferase-isomerase